MISFQLLSSYPCLVIGLGLLGIGSGGVIGHHLRLAFPSSVSANLPLVETYQLALSALGDPTRQAIFDRLADGPRAVMELADGLPVSRPAVSQHLRVLKEAGLVVDRRAGARRLYQVNLGGLGALRSYLDGFWDRALAEFKTAVETKEQQP
jgi:DNA-binding transcriptional ArsR family regulator